MLKKIENEIKTMPNYFEPYDTTVNFVSQEEFNKTIKQCHMVDLLLEVVLVVQGVNQNDEYSLKLDSNPEFTASVLVAYARATYKMALKEISEQKQLLMLHKFTFC